MSDDDTVSIEMERFTEKENRRQESPRASVNNEKVALNHTAKALTQKSDYPYVNFYIGREGKRLGLEPVKDGDVDANSYSFTDGAVTCKTVLRELDVELDWYSAHYAVEWLDDKGIFVVDFEEEL